MATFQGKAAIVTGGGSGIGRATAALLAQQGARVAVADVNDQTGRETVELIRKAEGTAIFVRTDVTRATDIQKLVDETMRSFGRIDLLHSNAGLMKPRASIEEVTEADWDLVVGVSLKGAFLGAKAVWPIMRKQGGGVIVNMSSMGGLVPLGVGLSYGAAKAGMVNLTRSLAQIGEGENIRVHCICPSSVATHLRDEYPPEIAAAMGAQDLQSEDIARAVAYLAGEESGTSVVMKVQLDRARRAVEYLKVASFDYQWAPVPGV